MSADVANDTEMSNERIPLSKFWNTFEDHILQIPQGQSKS